MTTLVRLTLLFLLFAPSAFAQGPAWTDWNTAYANAVKEKKVILVDAYTDWCGWCKRMDKDTYANSDVIKELGDGFIAVKFNPEKAGSYTVDGQTYNAQQLLGQLSNNQRMGYPTTFFVLPDGKNTTIMVQGYQPAKEFIDILRQVRTEAKKS